MNLLLTDAERQRFAEWLENEATTAKALIEQMEKLGVPAPLIAREKAEAGAALLIARRLRTTESYSIGPQENSNREMHKDADRLDFVMRKLPGSITRCLFGVVGDSGSLDEWRQKIDDAMRAERERTE
jgi:hypothetical protein